MGSERCDVLVVGAGPVGLMLGLLLQRNGVDVRIVERQKARYPLPRAVLCDHESRRLFGAAGLSKEIDGILENVIGEGGEDGINFVWRDADFKLIVDLFTEAPTRSGYPSIMGFTQPEVEGILEDAVIARGIPLMRGHALRALEQYPDHVEAKFSLASSKETECLENGVYKHGKSTESMSNGNHVNGHTNGHTRQDLLVEASYMIGCDGANSTVRRLSNIQVLHDGYLPPLVRRIGTAQICDPKRPTTTVFGGVGRKRFEFMRIPGESKEDLLKEEKMWELLAPWGWSRDNCDVERKVIYTFNARWANDFYKDRIALAGDALHLMPPFIGQGLNSGFRDAAALAWRLPLILSGLAKADPLFRTYQSERMDHLSKLTKHAILLGEVICETDPVKSKTIHKSLREHPPGKVYDPPLGQPGVLTTQPEAGRLSLQRKLRRPEGAPDKLFDDVYGYGWRLLNIGESSVAKNLSEDSQRFFETKLKGSCVNVTTEEDVDGEYQDWFADSLETGHAVLVRPDFYVFGYAPIREVDRLIRELREAMGAT